MTIEQIKTRDALVRAYQALADASFLDGEQVARIELIMQLIHNILREYRD